MLDHSTQQVHGGLDPVQVQVFIRLVRAGDITRAEHQRLAAKLLKVRCFGGKGHRLGGMPGQLLGEPDQLRRGRLVEGRDAGKQGARSILT